MPEHQPQVDEVFDEALRHAAAQDRARYLDEACGGDLELRRRVERLLRAVSEAGSFLEAPAQDPSPTVDQPAVEVPGSVIGPYKLIELIGEGGMGTVWMAQQTQPVKRLVALKLIKAGMDSKQVIARFEAERQALALMDHANIARVLDGGTTGAGRPYFVMDLVKGVPITKYCDEHHLTPRQRLELFLPVCQAIQHAHQKGIIHRDLKPSNVLVALYDGQPVPKVIDFGVAKAAGQQLTDKTLVTGFGSIVGTLEYMSPEQAEINQLDIDTRSDIYSLGVLLYELLTGSPPFTRKDLETAGLLETLRMIREREPSKPSTKLSTAEGLPTLAANRGMEPAKLTKLIRGELDWIVLKALEKERNRRYETANGFARDVQRYLADEPVLACPPSVRYRLRKFARRNKGPVLASSLVVLALVAGIIGTTWGMAVAVSETKKKEVALEAAQQSEREAKDKLWLSLYEQARARRFSDQPGQRLDSLAALAEAAGIRPEERLRDEAIAAMALPDLRRVPGWHSARPPGTTTAAYGGHYRLYARADTQGMISIRRIADDLEVRCIASGPITQGDNLYFSPDERFLLGFGEGHTLRVWRVADGQPALRDEPHGCNHPAFSPDGRHLAVGQQEWILCFDLATGQEVKRWRASTRVHVLAYHPDNDRLAVGYYDSGVVSLYDAASGDLVTDLPVGAMRYQTVAWHPDGERLAVGSADPRIQIWNVTAKRKVATLEGHVHNITDMTFHPEGGLLASHSWDGTLRLWDPSTGRPLLQLPLAISDRPRFSSDGRWLAPALRGERAQLLEVTPSREYRTLVSSVGASQGSYNLGDISPDGRLLAVGMDEGARLWDLRSGREVAVLPAWTVYVAFEGAGEATGPPSRPRALLTGGRTGLMRWPVTADDPEGKRLRLGPPQQLSLMRRAWFARTPDGRTLPAVTDEEGQANKILDLETGAVRRELGVHPQGEVKALSGDGRWAASSGWHSDRVRLWDVGTGQLVHEWVVGKQTFVFFTPDSRALIIARGDEFSFWDVETLQPMRRLPRDIAQFPGHVAFSPDGKLMAVEMAPAITHLKEVATGRTVARLEDPHGDRAWWQGFTPDGTQLVVVARYARAIHIWDLRAIRMRLKEMNLDWDWPEFPPAGGPRSPHADPPDVSVVGAEYLVWCDRAKSHADAKRWKEAVADYSKAIDLSPGDAHCWNARGVAHEQLGQWDKALADYAKAAELKATDPGYCTRHGFAFAQLRQWEKAAAIFEHATTLKPDDAHAWYFLALLELRRGDRAGYRKMCSGMLERFGQSTRGYSAHLTAWTCVLAPDAVADWTVPLNLAERAYADDRKDSDKIRHLGAVLYRTGRFQEAVQRLTEAEAAFKQTPSPQHTIVCTWLFQAMAHHRLGHTAEAASWLKKAVQALDEPSRETAQDPATMHWNQRLSLQLLRREAEELLGKKDQ
jgi:serine/threonine protein kinase/WD40 repeat protein/tetratricopeptide (TPR) repeat protein